MAYFTVVNGKLNKIVCTEESFEKLKNNKDVTIIESDTAKSGWDYDWSSNTAIEPIKEDDLSYNYTLKIENVKFDADSASFNEDEIECEVGTILTADFKIYNGNEKVANVNKSFRIPIISLEGRKRFIPVKFVNGIANVNVKFREAGCWEITQSEINDLLEDHKMNFNNLKIFVI